MNYFELYELPVQLSIDKVELRKKFLALSRLHHPDYFVQQEAGAQQQAMENSAQVNKAYKTLSNTDETIKYVLKLKDLLTEDEKYPLPPPFLMEVMELNEAVADAQVDTAEKKSVLQSVNQLETAIYEPVAEIIENYNEATTTEAEMLLVKEYYFKKKYLERLKLQLDEKL